MLIVYDITQTRERGLAGWPDPMPAFASGPMVSSPQLDLWHLLEPKQIPQWGMEPVSDDAPPFWDQLHLVGQAEQSQYDILRKSKLNFPHRLACVALCGKGFHGQRQRPWQALSGNLHLSLSVPLNLESGPGALAWTMLPAVAVMRALKHLGAPENDSYGIKWVNDVLWGSRKLGGVISSLSVADGKIHRGFLGIGLNVAEAPELPVETCYLHEFMDPKNVPLGLVLNALLASLAELILLMENDQGALIFQQYRRHCMVIGRQVRILTDPVDGISREFCRGKVLDINPDLGLVVEGQKAPVLHGRLQFLE
jgi:biotin-(acetyl-CoA carboxylase) ligase